MKYKQEETLFETLYLHLQEEYSLFLPRKPCPRSWRTYCTSWFRASNWEDVPLLDQTDRKIFSVRNLYTFLGESSFESSESVQEPRGGGGGYSGIFWVGMCRPGLQIWTPF